MPTYLRPMGLTAPAAIVCGEPARALAIAQEVLVKPKMSNHNRALWGYHGLTPTGSELTVHATGIGGPSAAIAVEELLALGVERLIRIGTCNHEAGRLGSPLVAGSIRGLDATSNLLGAPARDAYYPDPELTGALSAGLGGPAAETVELTSFDHPAAAADATGPWDLQSAAIASLAAARGTRFAVASIVSRSSDGPIEDDPLEAAVLKLAGVASAALEG